MSHPSAGDPFEKFQDDPELLARYDEIHDVLLQEVRLRYESKAQIPEIVADKMSKYLVAMGLILSAFAFVNKDLLLHYDGLPGIAQFGLAIGAILLLLASCLALHLILPTRAEFPGYEWIEKWLEDREPSPTARQNVRCFAIWSYCNAIKSKEQSNQDVFYWQTFWIKVLTYLALCLLFSSTVYLRLAYNPQQSVENQTMEAMHALDPKPEKPPVDVDTKGGGSN